MEDSINSLNTSLKVCPHINSLFLNGYLTKHAFCNDNFCTNLNLIKDKIEIYKKFGFSKAKNLMEKIYIRNFSQDWVLLHNPQNLPFQSINKDGCIFSFNFDDNGKIMGSANNEHKIEIWDIEKKKFKCTLNDHKEIVTGIEFFHSDSSKFLSCSLDKTIKLWNNYKCAHTFTEHSDWIRCISLSNDNNKMLSGCVSSVIKLWDLPKQMVIFNILNNNGDNQTLATINSLSFLSSNPNVFLAGIRSGEVKLFDIRAYQKSSGFSGNSRTLIPVQEFKAHERKLNNVKLNRNDSYLLSSGRDSTIRLWDVRNLPNKEEKNPYEKYLYEYKKHKCTGYNIESNFYINDQYILTGSEDYGFYMYESLNPNNYCKFSTKQKCINLIKPVPKSLSIMFGGLEDVSLFHWKANKAFSKEAEKRYNEKNNECKEFEEDNESDDDEEFFDRGHQFLTSIIEEVMSECGDAILKIFHSNNRSYSSGLNMTTLMEIIQKDNNEESMKVLRTINEKIFRMMTAGMNSPDSFIGKGKNKNSKNKVKNNDNNNKIKKSKNEKIQCHRCNKISINIKSNKVDKNQLNKLLDLPNQYQFCSIDKDKKENKDKENNNVKIDNKDIETNKIMVFNEEKEKNVGISFFKGIV